MDPRQFTCMYHERTKHTFHRYARALGYMDWDTQADPFRRYIPAPLIRLPLPGSDRTPPYDRLFQLEPLPARSLRRETIADFLYDALSLSAWKVAQSGGVEAGRWALRVNPSSGNLHPTEAYLLIDAVDGLHEAPAVYHYAPKEHGLELRTSLSDIAWKSMTAGLPPGAFLVGLSSIHWREAWKYGERAFRYCQHDVGHALAALRIAAATLGWRLETLYAVSDLDAARLMGLSRLADFPAGEPETPDLLAVVIPGLTPGVMPDLTPGVIPGLTPGETPGALSESSPGPTPVTHLADWQPPVEAARELERGLWSGRPNQLSRDHYDWDIIDAVSEACRKNGGPLETTAALPAMIRARHAPGRLIAPIPLETTARRIIRQRRSAVSMDGRTGTTAAHFYATLSRVVPALCPMPWDAVSWPTSVHLGLFVHRIEGLEPGLYALVRDADQLEPLRSSMHAAFEWTVPPGCPEDLPLYRLKALDVQSVATRVSCGQDIAGQSAFSLGMIARFAPALDQHGAHFYRNLFWETGMIGQVLYLEAEARGLRATGIGCFFDDPVHEVFGLSDDTWQSLYHFTVGGPLDDQRLTTLPAYPDRAAR